MSGRAAWHKSQSGTTLVELLVATVIMGLALALLIGMFSTGAIDSRLAKRDAIALAAKQYEKDKIMSSPYGSTGNYSDCFETDGSVNAGSCGSSGVEADVSMSQVTVAGATVEQWTVTITSGSTQVGSPMSIYKASR